VEETQSKRERLEETQSKRERLEETQSQRERESVCVEETQSQRDREIDWKRHKDGHRGTETHRHIKVT
jgi:hypothetical protein